jgi:hypothetical protein
MTEPHALPSIRRVREDALILPVESWKDLSIAVRRLDALYRESGELVADGQRIETVVLDGLTDLHELARDAYTTGEGDDTDTDWGRVQSGMRSLLRMLRGLPVSIVALALSQSVDEGKRFEPVLYGARMRASVGQWFSGVGFAQRIEHEGGIRYVVRWRASSRYYCKPVPGGPDLSVVDLDADTDPITDILNQVYGEKDAQ